MPTTLTLANADGQPAQQFTLPTAWPDVTLAQYLALAAAVAPAAELLLSGLTAEQWAGLDEADRGQLSRLLLFVLDEQPLQELLPTPSLYEVGRCAYGLLLHAQQHLATTPDAHPLAHGAYLYALYREPVGTHPIPADVAAVYAAVLALPVTEVYADCQHFLTSYHRPAGSPLPDGPTQPGLLRLVIPQAPPTGLLARASQWLSRRAA